ncbi:hypothetical protein ATO2_12850 [Roseovarius sp. 22II1-1F6A]|nr:hypothetical protein ATO2_12850 [Roseovarius sp. 22II1-1F6A]
MSVTGAILTPGVVFAPRLPVLPRFPLQPEGLFRDGTAGALMDASALTLAGRALFYTDAGNTAAEPSESIHTFLDTARARLWSSGAAYGALEGNHATNVNDAQQPALGSAPVEVRNLLADSADFTQWSVDSAAVTPRPVSGKDADFLVADTKSFSRYSGAVLQGLDYPTGEHIVWADLEEGTARYAVIGIDNNSGYEAGAAFDLQTGTVIGFNGHVAIGMSDARMVPLAGGGYRCEVVFSRSDTNAHVIRISSSVSEPPRGGTYGYDTDGDGVSGIYLYGAQLEAGDTATAFQETDAANLCITEGEKPCYNFLRFDGVDDKLSQVMPDGLDGDVMIFGRKGSWIDAGVTVAPGGTLTAINGADSVNTPGIISVLGDIVGWLALDRAITSEEQADLLAYYAKRGAGGLYTLGPELVVNGDFSSNDLSMWTPFSSDSPLEIVSGEARSTATISGGDSGRNYQVIPTVVGRPYIATIRMRAGTGRSFAYLGWVANGTHYGIKGNSATVMREYTFTFEALTSSTYFGVRADGPANGKDAYFDNVSVKELVQS